MKKSQIIALVAIVLILLGFNVCLMDNGVSDHEELTDLVNHEHVSPQRLFDNTWGIIRDTYYDADLNNQSWARWKEHYKGKIHSSDDAKVAIDTMLSSLDDPYSKFMTSEEYNEQNNSISSKFYGIGVNIVSNAGKIEITNVLDGSPAKAANLMPKDIILEVNGIDIKGLSIADVAKLVKGPESTSVEITVLRNNQKITKKIIRKEIKIKAVKSYVDKNIGYIQITSFVGASTPNDFMEALEKTKNTDGLILDLRGNTGGLLPNAIFIANLFIPEGNLVSVVGRNGYRYNITAQDTEFYIDKPMVVLVDGISASASEILSGALKDYKRAKLLGTKTYGKGMVQKIIPLPNETGLNLTTAKYLTPAGHDINKSGITPDIEVEFSLEDVKTQNDVQLSAAKNTLAKMIRQ